jgi:outer membrane lipoprotein SlyB
MNASTIPLPNPAINTKPLWAAVGVLGVAVVALGASLIYVQNRPVDGHAALAAISTPASVEVAAAGTRVAPTASLAPREDLVAPAASPAPAPARQTVAKPVTRAVPASNPAPAVRGHCTCAGARTRRGRPEQWQPTACGPVGGHRLRRAGEPTRPVAPRVVCGNCGTIETVTPIQRNAKSGTGVGAVAGGALGAVVGNQIGKGSGRMLATVLGAVGGGLAGNSIEKNMKKETVYQVQVRMEDGSLRTLEQSRPGQRRGTRHGRGQPDACTAGAQSAAPALPRTAPGRWWCRPCPRAWTVPEGPAIGRRGGPAAAMFTFDGRHGGSVRR